MVKIDIKFIVCYILVNIEIWTSCYLKKSNYKIIVKTTWSMQQNLNTNIMTDWVNGDKHLRLMIILGGNGDTKNVIEY